MATRMGLNYTTYLMNPCTNEQVTDVSSDYDLDIGRDAAVNCVRIDYDLLECMWEILTVMCLYMMLRNIIFDNVRGEEVDLEVVYEAQMEMEFEDSDEEEEEEDDL